MGILSLFKALAFCLPWTFLSVIVIFFKYQVKLWSISNTEVFGAALNLRLWPPVPIPLAQGLDVLLVRGRVGVTSKPLWPLDG